MNKYSTRFFHFALPCPSLLLYIADFFPQLTLKNRHLLDLFLLLLQLLLGWGGDDEPIWMTNAIPFVLVCACISFYLKYSDLRVNFCMTLLVVCSASCLLLPVASGKTWHTGVTSQKWCIWSKEVNTDLEIQLKGGLKTLALRVSTNSSFSSHKVLLFIFYVIVNHESFYIETYMNFDCCHLF